MGSGERAGKRTSFKWAGAHESISIERHRRLKRQIDAPFQDRSRFENPALSAPEWRDSLLFLDGPVTEEQIVKVSIVNVTPLVTENLLTHRLINLNVGLPEVGVLLICLIN